MSERKHPLGTIAELDEEAIKGLDEGLRGDLILPDSEAYEDARNVWNGLINKYPAIITRVKGATDVATAIQFARENDLEVSIRGGAHDALRSVEVVTPDGELRKASPDHDEALFWAARGGGGNFGVVTNFEFELYEVGPMVQGLGIFYPAAIADDVLESFGEVMVDAPEELTTILINGHVPNLPPMPDELAGTDAVGVLGCYAGDPEEGAEVIAPLRDIGDPLIDMSDVMPYEMLHDLGTQMYPWGRKYTHRSVFVDELTDDVHDIILEQTEAAPAPMAAIAVWPLGGNIGHGPDAAYAWDEKQYMLTIEGNWEEFQNQPTLDWAAETERLLRDAGGEGAYAGFTGVEQREWEDWTEQVYGDSYERLTEAKAAYDPENVFSQNINIEPDGA